MGVHMDRTVYTMCIINEFDVWYESGIMFILTLKK